MAKREAWVSEEEQAWFDGGLKTEGSGKDVQVLYEVTLKFVISATAPITKDTMAELVTQRIEANRGEVEAGDIHAAEIMAVEPL